MVDQMVELGFICPVKGIEEKITDSINYFLLLKGIVEEDMITAKCLQAPMGGLYS